MSPFLRLLALAALAAPVQAQVSDWALAPRVPIDLKSFRYDPGTITLDHGQPYILHLENQSNGGHNFAAKRFFAAAQVMEDDRASVRDGVIELSGHEATDIHLIAPAPGRYEVHCTHFLHSTFGMKGEIVVR